VGQDQSLGLMPADGAQTERVVRRKYDTPTTPAQRPRRPSWRKRMKLALYYGARAIGLCNLARWLTRRSVLIVGWHCVSLTDEHVRFPSLCISRETFRQRLEFLRRHYRIITLDELLRQKRAGRIEPSQAILTFDDGYYDVYAGAAPILRELDMPATFYMVTERIDSQRPTFNHLISDMILQSRLSAAHLTVPGVEGAARLDTQAGRVALMQRAMAAYPLEPQRQEAFARRLAAELEVDIDDLIRRRVWHAMNADEVRELAEMGLFDFQLHTHEHKNVIDYADIAYEQARVCRERLEALTGRPARHFCYPQGFWCRETWESLERAGVETAATAQHGPNFVQTPDLALRRFLDGEDRTQVEFEVETSHLRWLWYAVRHPGRLAIPNEKRQPYFESQRLF